jgi:hypothetical protein
MRMKPAVMKPPSSEQIRDLVMQMCTRERLAELAEQKGIKDAQQMSKQELCRAILS